jgi:hypothetical protein
LALLREGSTTALSSWSYMSERRSHPLTLTEIDPGVLIGIDPPWQGLAVGW